MVLPQNRQIAGQPSRGNALRQIGDLGSSDLSVPFGRVKSTESC
jgi:hypothetical protein